MSSSVQNLTGGTTGPFGMSGLVFSRDERTAALGLGQHLDYVAAEADVARVVHLARAAAAMSSAAATRRDSSGSSGWRA
jgi:hypothetical protein